MLVDAGSSRGWGSAGVRVCCSGIALVDAWSLPEVLEARKAQRMIL